MTVSYISHLDYIFTPTGLEYSSLLGNSLRLSSAVSIGATSLPVMPASGGTSTSVDLRQFDLITIYDGLSTEVVTVASDTTFPSTTIPLQNGCLFAHAQYTPCSSSGVAGDLGQEILRASARLENITKQSLWSTTQSETIRMPTMRASIDNNQVLTFRTKQFPITAISALSIQTNVSDAIAYDPTQAIIDVNELVTVPRLVTSGSSTYSIMPSVISRAMNAYVVVTYTAGYTSLTMPRDVIDATILLTSAQLARRDNPVGADTLREGQGMIVATLRGDQSGDSLLEKRAKQLLSNYVLRIL